MLRALDPRGIDVSVTLVCRVAMRSEAWADTLPTPSQSGDTASRVDGNPAPDRGSLGRILRADYPPVPCNRDSRRKGLLLWAGHDIRETGPGDFVLPQEHAPRLGRDPWGGEDARCGRARSASVVLPASWSFGNRVSGGRVGSDEPLRDHDHRSLEDL